MNPVERTVRRVDRLQQEHAPLAFVFGVVKKFGDDRGPSLAALLAYYGFLSLFPLLLILATILGFIGNADVSDSVVGSTLRQFPVLGQQIGSQAAHPLTGSPLALAAGLLFLLYGALGVAQAAQHTMAQVWNIPGARRPGFLPRIVRGLAFFAALGFGMAATAVVSGVSTLGGQAAPVRIVSLVAGAALDVLLVFVAFRLLTPGEIGSRALVPGAVVGGLGYAVLLTLGTALVQHQLRHAEAVYGQFGFVLGLLAWLFLVSQLILYAAELNVVWSRRLWPRSLVQPPLTAADEAVLGEIVRQEQRRPEERVAVGFSPGVGSDAAPETSSRRGSQPAP